MPTEPTILRGNQCPGRYSRWPVFGFALGWTPIGTVLINFQVDGDNSSSSTTAYLDMTAVGHDLVVAPNGTATFNVSCAPTLTGTINGQFFVTDDAPSPTQIAALSCTGGTPASNGLTVKGGVLISGGVRLLQPGP